MSFVSALKEFIDCTIIDESTVSCNGSLYKLEEKKLDYHDKMFWIYLAIYSALVIIAGAKYIPLLSRNYF